MADGASSSSSAGAPPPPPLPAQAAGSVSGFLDQMLNEDDVEINPEQVDELVAWIEDDITEAPPSPDLDLDMGMVDELLRDGAKLFEEMDQLVVDPKMLKMDSQFLSAFNKGKFEFRVLDILVEHKWWMDVVAYLGRCIKFHAEDCVVPVPDGTLPEDLDKKVHAELFLSPHRQHCTSCLPSRTKPLLEATMTSTSPRFGELQTAESASSSPT